MTRTTDAAGSFKFKAFDPNLEYQISADKESYVFSEFDKETSTFSGQKLSEIITVVKDVAGKPLSSVLLSLSSADLNLKKNLKTSDDGIIKFHSLTPNTFYLKAFKKEFKFEPHSQVIEVKNGETIQAEMM